MFTFGIEHEVAFLNKDNHFVDWSVINFAELNQIINQLPLYTDDYSLYIGDAKIREKRWYLEGIERFNNNGDFIHFDPKGIEIRTTIHSSISSTIEELTQSFSLLRSITKNHGLTPVLISFNPYQTHYSYQPPLNAYELKLRQDDNGYQMEHLAMLTYGPDLNIGQQGLSFESLLDLSYKLIAYSPYIIPFSFSSPFYNGQLWQGRSVRSFFRAAQRPTVRLYVDKNTLLATNNMPPFVNLARIPSEIGRLEFKAFDSCDNFLIYAGLLALLKGLLLDKTLSERASIADTTLYQHVAKLGFDDEAIALKAKQIIMAAETALGIDEDAQLLQPLKRMLQQRQTPADTMIAQFKKTHSITHVLQQSY